MVNSATPSLGLALSVVATRLSELVAHGPAINVQTRAAAWLGINRNTLQTKLIEYNLVEEEET